MRSRAGDDGDGINIGTSSEVGPLMLETMLEAGFMCEAKLVAVMSLVLEAGPATLETMQ